MSVDSKDSLESTLWDSTLSITRITHLVRIDNVNTVSYTIHMKVTYTLQGISFEWESSKAFANLQKHEIAFEAACQVFFDPFLSQDKEDIVDGELRERVIGMTESWQFLYVVYTLRNDAIRLISARPATRQERKTYETQ